MSTLIISPKPMNDYHFHWHHNINDISINLYEMIFEVRNLLLSKKYDKYDNQVVLASVSNAINQKLLNGETLFLYVRPLSQNDVFYNDLKFLMNKIIKFTKSLYTCNVVFLKPCDINENDDMASLMHNNNITFSGTNKEIKKKLEGYLENDIVDLNEYDEIVRIGDIQGCLNNLEKALPNGIDNNKFYVFLGDYIDRGPDSLGVLKWLKKHCFNNNKLKNNVILLMGNHERHLVTWTLNMEPTSKSFMKTTFPQIKDGKHNSLINLILSSLKASFIYTYKGHTTICCHAGIEYDLPHYPFNPINLDEHERDKKHWLIGSLGGLHNMWQFSDKELYGAFLKKNRNIGEKFIDNMMKNYAKNNHSINLELVYGHFHIKKSELSWENSEYNLRAVCHENDVDRGGKLVVSYDHGKHFLIKEF